MNIRTELHLSCLSKFRTVWQRKSFENFISSNNEIYNYIDFVKYAEDLISEQPYTFVKTEDDRVVELMY
mgnify:CR=1 FL=1